KVVPVLRAIDRVDFVVNAAVGVHTREVKRVGYIGHGRVLVWLTRMKSESIKLSTMPTPSGQMHESDFLRGTTLFYRGHDHVDDRCKETDTVRQESEPTFLFQGVGDLDLTLTCKEADDLDLSRW